MMSPYLQRPLDMGVDISYDSGTKFLSGHHDLMAGVVTCRTEETGKVRPFVPPPDLSSRGSSRLPFFSVSLGSPTPWGLLSLLSTVSSSFAVVRPSLSLNIHSL